MKKIGEDIIDIIQQLRKKGWSLPEIQQELKIGYGTVYRYIKNVDILPEYKHVWLGKRGGSIKRKLQLLEKAAGKAKTAVASLSTKEKLLFISAIYWGEGGKKDFGLSNTDPMLVQLFINGLRDVFNVPEENIKLSIRIYEDLDREKCLNYWASITGISKEKFVGVNILKGNKKGKLEYGMCRLRVRKGGDLLKYIKAVNSEVYGLFISPRSSIG